MKQTAFRLGESDLATLDKIRERYNLVTRTAALRFILNDWEKIDSKPLNVFISKKARRK